MRVPTAIRSFFSLSGQAVGSVRGSILQKEVCSLSFRIGYGPLILCKRRMTRRTRSPIDRNDLRPGFIVCVNPFEAKITPRSPRHSKVIEDTWKEELEVSLDENQQWKATPDGIARLIERVAK